MAEDWYDKEPSLRAGMTRELQRIARRARDGPIRILLVTVLCTAGLLWKVSHRAKNYTARIILKVEESEVSEEATPLPSQGLRDYVATLSFTKDNLLGVIGELGLFPEREDLGDEFAVESFRENIGVEVYRNFFVDDRGYESGTRSARIAVLYTDSDPEQAYRIAHRLATLIVESEQVRRATHRAEGLTDAEAKVDAANERLTAKYAAIGQAGVDLANAAGNPGKQAAIRFRIRQLEESAHADRDTVRAAVSELRDVQLSHALAAESLDLEFTVVDERIPRPPGSQRNLLIMLGTVAFFTILPAVAILFGAFDSRIHHREDVQRLGFPIVGHVPGFPGDRVGCLRERSAPRDRVT